MRRILSIGLFVGLLAVILLWPNVEAQTASHGVFLTWNAPVVDATHSAASSYNVYRGTAAGTETTLVANVTTTSYVDSLTGLTPGSTYFYIVRSVNAVGVEDGASNEVSGAIPNASGAAAGLQAVVK